MIVREALGVITAAAIGGLLIWHAAATNWHRLMVLNGDSLIMPMIARSLERGEPFDWVFSSQLFVFPEGPLFALSWLVTRAAAPSIAVNIVVTILAMYVLLRWIARWTVGPAVWRPMAAVLAIMPFAACAALEYNAAYGGPEVANLFLVSSYYYGVTIAALLTSALVLEATRGFSERSWGRRGAFFLVAAGIVTALATFSDPLTMIQTLPPFGAGLLLVAILGRLTWRRAFAIAGTVGTLAIIGYLARFIAADYTVSSTAYIHVADGPLAADFLYRSLALLASGHRGLAEVLLLAATLAASLAVVVLATIRRMPAPLIWASSIPLLTAVSCIGGTIVTGSQVTRYLTPIFVMTSLGVLAGFGAAARTVGRTWTSPSGTRRRRSWSTAMGATLAVLLGVPAILGVPRSAESFQARQPLADGACLSAWVGGRQLTGGAAFWVARPLNLYGKPNIDLLQLNFDLTAQGWLVNLDEFRNKRPTYFVVSPEVDWGSILRRRLGDPAHIVRCPGMQIWDYSGTNGAEKLSAIVAASLNSYLVRRGEH